MTLSASFLLLLLLLGLSQAIPLQDEEEDEDDLEFVDISSKILTTNNGSSHFLLEGDLLAPVTRNAMNCWNGNCLWQKGRDGLVTIPYTIESQYGASQRQIIEHGLRSFHGVSCIRFVPRTHQRDYLYIASRGACFSAVGRQGGYQELSLDASGCLYRGIVQHEVLHALGFRHEHNRSDRDSHVRINWNNIVQQNAYNFNKQNTNNLGVPYDYASIMHYGKTAFSVDGRKLTIVPIPNQHVNIGQRRGLSTLDVLKLKKLYNC